MKRQVPGFAVLGAVLFLASYSARALAGFGPAQGGSASSFTSANVLGTANQITATPSGGNVTLSLPSTVDLTTAGTLQWSSDSTLVRHAAKTFWIGTGGDASGTLSALQYQAAAGSTSTPSLAFSGDLTSGIFDGGNGAIQFVKQGTSYVQVGNGIELAAAAALYWSSTASPIGSVDTYIARLGAAGVIGLGNSTSPTELRIFGTTDTIGGGAPTNYEALSILTTAGGATTIATVKGGTGTLRTLQFGPATMTGTFTLGANTLALASATVSGTPTWSSNQAITLSTAAQPNVTSVGTLAGITMTGTLAMSSTPVISGSPACTLGATTVTTLGTAGNVTLAAGNNIVLATSTGTDIGTATTQLLGFFGQTPVANTLALATATNIAWNADTSVSRDAAGAVDIGTGAQGSQAGTLNLTTANLLGKVAKYNNVATAGEGVADIRAQANITAQSSNATITSYANPAADGDFEVSAQMSVTASTTLTTTLTCTYTDAANVARTMIFPVQSVSGTFVAAGAITGAGASIWETPVMHIRVKASTTITILTSAGTFTGVTYSASGVIKKMS